MVVGILDKGIRKKLLQESKLTLQSCIDICTANECTKQQLQTMDQPDEVNAVDERKPRRDRKLKSKNDTKSDKTPKLINCKFGAKKHEEKKEKCPAWGKTCDKCGAKNHFSVVCNKHRPPPHHKKPRDTRKDRQSRSNVNMNYEQEESDSDDYCLMVESVNSVYQKKSPKKIFSIMVVKETSVKFQLDSGATVNILPVEIYHEVQKDPELKHLKNTQSTLVMFNNSELKPLGTVELQTRNPKNGECYLIEYTVVSNGFKALLGASSIQQLSLMSVNVDNIMLISDTPNGSSVLADYKEVFSGEGKLEEKLHLTVDKTVSPVILPVRKVPLAVKEPLRKEIERLVAQEILKPVDTPTDWVSSMVVVMKSNGKIRLCIDPKPLNQALKRNHYPTSDTM